MSDPGAEPVGRRPRIAVALAGAPRPVDAAPGHHRDHRAGGRRRPPGLPPDQPGRRPGHLGAGAGDRGLGHRRARPAVVRVQSQHAGRGRLVDPDPAVDRCCPAPTSSTPSWCPRSTADLLLSVEATSTSPLTIQYVINPKAVWSDGVPVTRRRLHLRLAVPERETGSTSTASPTRWPPPSGYRDVASVTVQPRRQDGDGGVRHAVHRLAGAVRPHGAGPHRPEGRVEPRIRHVQPGRRPVGRAHCMVQSVSSEGTAVLVRNPRWWGTPSVLDRGHGRTWPPNQAAWTAALGERQPGRQPSRPPSTSARSDAVSSLPNTQSTVNRRSTCWTGLQRDARR